MIARLIRWSVHNRPLVLLTTLIIVGWGIHSVATTPLDAIPDLSDVQVIVHTTYAGQAPQIVEDQVTHPLTSMLLSVPFARTVRGYSLFGESFVYVLFDDDTDLYTARSRVLEYLAEIKARLPSAARSVLGPDATGVGWIYEYALVDRTGRHDLGELRALQEWFLKYELKSVPNVAEVATLGGFNRQYQIVLDPNRLIAQGLTIATVVDAVQKANSETGGSVLELAEAEYMVRSRGYLRSLQDFTKIAVGYGAAGAPILLRDVANVQLGPETRRGIADLDGEGEVVGGIIIQRHGQNALQTIRAVKARLATLQRGLPAGVEIATTYDRSVLIKHAVENLARKLFEEFIVVALVCAAFLCHWRSALVAVITLPIGVLTAFIVMRLQGVTANIMSLGGIAIAIGAMVDAAVVMTENAHKRLEAWRHANAGCSVSGRQREELIVAAATDVGPALFFSLLIITFSFAPVLALQAQEGRLFAPLAYTKTYAMAAAAGLSVTLIPVLMVTFIRGRIRDESRNPLNRVLMAAYRPVIEKVLVHPWLALAVPAVLMVATAWPVMQLGSEFMPSLDEGDLLYMPTAMPGLAVGKAAQVLQQTDRIIKAFPEVERVFGKAGRAETATDPAPLEMIETTIQLKPKDQWRPGMTTPRLIEAMDRQLQLPGMGNVWVQPIRNRIDMLATGIKSPVGIKVAGTDLGTIENLSIQIETILRQVPGTVSVFSERAGGGRYIEVNPDRDALARYGLSISDFNQVVAVAVAGENIGETIEGLARFPINVRYPRELRDSVQDLRNLPFMTERGAIITLGQVADLKIVDGASLIKSENGRPNGWIYVDTRDRDLGTYVREAQHLVDERLELPAGYSMQWSGQFEFMQRAAQRLRLVVPLTLFVIVLLLFLTFGRLAQTALIVASLPLALIGGFWLMYLLGHHLSVASGVGFIALAGIAAEFGVVMLIYLDQAVRRRASDDRLRNLDDLRAAIVEGAVQRLRPKAMTVAVITAGLLPLYWSMGTGSEFMQRIAAPMLGGMITAPLLSMIVLPAAYFLIAQRQLAARAATDRRSDLLPEGHRSPKT